MKYTLIAAAAAAAAVSSPAMAQDVAVGGFHVEGVLGYDSTRASVDYEDTAFPADNFEESGHSDGVLYGVNAGYDFALGTNTLGVEAGYEMTDNKRCDEVFGGDALCASLKRNIYVGLKGSMPLAPRTALTAGIGYVNGKARLSYDDLSTTGVDLVGSDSRDGFRLSAGLEQRFGGNFFGKLEYRYADYKDYNYVDGTESVALGFRRHQVVAGLGVKF